MALFEQIRKIYNKLEDKASKDIFMKRLQYSLSGDSRYIQELVHCEMERYGRTDIMVQMIDWIDKNYGSVVIFGAGCAGKQIASVLRFMNKKVICFLDNNRNLYGSKIEGLRICNPEILLYDKECGIVIATNDYVSEIEEQLIHMGIEQERIFLPTKSWWLGTEEQYFDRDIMKAHSHESFVDGGALDGGDSIKFIQWCNEDYDAVYMFEPDKYNYQKLSTLKSIDKRMKVYEEGLWNEIGEVSFLSGNKEKCFITESGDTTIRVTSIDDKLQEKPVSIIKMDIEGSEMKALEGAKNTIKKFKPRLAICVYHRPEDIVDIPLKVLELNPEYKIYMRHYSYIHTETVLYAI